MQVEILLSGLWDPSSGNLFAEEGDQQRFWKITRKFVEQMAAVCGGNVKAVQAPHMTCLKLNSPLLVPASIQTVQHQYFLGYVGFIGSADHNVRAVVP